MIKGMHHVAISTSNLERLLRFYCDDLGLELVAEMDWKPGSELGTVVDRIVGHQATAAKVAMVSTGNVLIEMFEYEAPSPKSVAPEWRGYDHGYTHICLEVENIDAAYEKLNKAGMTFREAPPREAYQGMKCLYGRDPEGHFIELLEASQES